MPRQRVSRATTDIDRLEPVAVFSFDNDAHAAGLAMMWVALPPATAMDVRAFTISSRVVATAPPLVIPATFNKRAGGVTAGPVGATCDRQAMCVALVTPPHNVRQQTRGVRPPVLFGAKPHQLRHLTREDGDFGQCRGRFSDRRRFSHEPSDASVTYGTRTLGASPSTTPLAVHVSRTRASGTASDAGRPRTSIRHAAAALGVVNAI